jgi:hypothetical protein
MKMVQPNGLESEAWRDTAHAEVEALWTSKLRARMSATGKPGVRGTPCFSELALELWKHFQGNVSWSAACPRTQERLVPDPHQAVRQIVSEAIADPAPELSRETRCVVLSMPLEAIPCLHERQSFHPRVAHLRQGYSDGSVYHPQTVF